MRDNVLKKQLDDVQEARSALRQLEMDWKLKLKSAHDEWENERNQWKEEIQLHKQQIENLQQHIQQLQLKDDPAVQATRKKKIEEKLKEIEQELEKRRKDRVSMQLEMEHKLRVSLHSESVLEQFVKHREEETNVILQLAHSMKNGNLKSLTEVATVPCC